VLKEISYMHRDLTKIIISLFIFKFDFACQKKTNKNDDENFCEQSERDREALQQEHCKTSERQNNHSDDRKNEHDHRLHEERIT
jgi:hypothetical protein